MPIFFMQGWNDGNEIPSASNEIAHPIREICLLGNLYHVLLGPGR